MARARVKVSEAIARAVASEVGDTPIFALIGDANLRLVGALDLHAKANLCFARDEGAAVAMADGFAQAGHRLGVASVTSGPGLTHAATSLLAAGRMRTPLVVIAGDTPRQSAVGLQAMMKIDQRRFAEACEAAFQDVSSPSTLTADIRGAFDRARTERKPVILNVPLDLQTADVSEGWAYAPPAPAPRAAPAPSARDLGRMIEAIASSTRPLILAGRGAVWSNARSALLRLGAEIGALFGTTLLAKGFFDESAWSVGGVGGFMSPARMDLVRQADLVLAFGAELGHFTTQGGSLYQGRTVVSVDVAARHDTLPPAVLAIQADAREAADALRVALAKGPRRTGFRTAETEQRLAAPILGDVTPPADGRIDPRKLMLTLNDLIPKGARVVVGGGHFWSFPCLYLKPPEHGAFLCPLGAAAVGQALPFAIGVAMSAPASPVLAIEGDGSLLMNIQEFDTAARHRLPLVIVIMNDGALTAEAIRLRLEGYKEGLAVYPSPDFAAVAKGFGWKAATAGDDADVAKLLRGHAWHDGPLLIDARISRDIVVDPTAIRDLSRRPKG